MIYSQFPKMIKGTNTISDPTCSSSMWICHKLVESIHPHSLDLGDTNEAAWASKLGYNMVGAITWGIHCLEILSPSMLPLSIQPPNTPDLQGVHICRLRAKVLDNMLSQWVRKPPDDSNPWATGHSELRPQMLRHKHKTPLLCWIWFHNPQNWWA